MDDLRKLQLEELDMLKLFADICTKHGLRYYLLGGTLLGAVRHKGFIPWDDDVDVCMPRKDYQHFIELAKTELPKRYYIDNYDLSPDYYYAWARICSRGMKVINHMANIPRIEPIFIDVIPLDGFPDPGIERTLHKLRLSFWWNLNQVLQFDKLVDQKRQRGKLEKAAIAFVAWFKWLGKILSFKTCLKKLNEILCRYPYDSDTKEIINYLAAYGFQETFLRESFEEGREYEFEGLEFIGPKDYDHVCRTIYGDYMTLPPEDQRNKHHTEILKDNE